MHEGYNSLDGSKITEKRLHPNQTPNPGITSLRIKEDGKPRNTTATKETANLVKSKLTPWKASNYAPTISPGKSSME